MSTDKKVRVTVDSQAAGDGIKRTDAGLKDLNQTTEAAGMSGQKFVGETRQWTEAIDEAGEATEETKEAAHGLVKEFEKLEEEVKKTTTTNKSYSKSEKKVGDEAKKEARNLDKVNKELAEAKRRLTAAAVGSKEFTRAQARVNTLSKEYSRAMPRATKSTRNFGLAALEGSRAMEDLQYGVGGVLNNIPGLVMMLGGSAGLTAVISLVAVGIHQLTKETKQAEEEMEESVDRAADRRNKANKQAKEGIEEYSESLSEGTRAAEVEADAIDHTTKMLKQQISQRAEVALAQIDLDLVVNRNSNKPDDEKAKVEESLLKSRRDVAKQLGKEQLEASKNGVESAIEQLKIDRKRLIEMENLAKKQRDWAAESRGIAEVYEAERYKAEEKLFALAQKKDKAFKWGRNTEDLGDFEQDGKSKTQQVEDYMKSLAKTADDIDPDDERVQSYKKALVEALHDLQKVLTETNKAQNASGRAEREASKYEGNANLNKEASKDGLIDVEKQVTANQRILESLEGQLATKKTLLKIDGKMAEEKKKAEAKIVKLEQKKTNISSYTAQRAGGNLGDLGDEDNEVQGDSKDEIKQHKANIAEGAKDVASIIDGGVDGSEFKPLIAALEKMKGSMAKDNASGLTAVNSLLAVSKLQAEKMKETNKQIETLKKQVAKLGAGK